MKKLLVIPALFLGLSLMAQPPKVDAKSGMTFGDAITAEGAIDVNVAAKNVGENSKGGLKITGEVIEVCKAEGCWLRMKTETGSVLVKMKDHKYLVPLSLTGKTIVAEGEAKMKETSVEMLRHYAEDAGKSKAEIDAITEPKREMVMQASGILVM